MNTTKAEEILGLPHQEELPTPPKVVVDDEPEREYPEPEPEIDPSTGLPPTPEVSAKWAKIRSLLRGSEWDRNSTIPVPEPVFTLNGQVWATPGNLSAFSGASKSGKSAVTGGIIGATLGLPGDTFGFEAKNPHGFAVIHLDTEQSRYHHDKKLQSAFRRVDTPKTDVPPWFRSYLLTGINIDLDYLKVIMSDAAAQFGGVHSVILDGAVDLIRDCNSIEESNQAVSDLMLLADSYNTHIICIIHTNPGSEKTRGHFGSQLERKAETNLTIKVDKDNRVVYARTARDCAIPEDKGTQFRWDDEAMMFMSVDSGAGELCDGYGWMDALELISNGPTPKKDLKVTILDSVGVTERTFNRLITRLKTEKLIREEGTRTNKIIVATEKGIKALRDSGRHDPSVPPITE